MRNHILLHWCPPVLASMPSPAFSIFKAQLEKNNDCKVQIIYWNIILSEEISAFFFNDLYIAQQQNINILFYNYLSHYYKDSSSKKYIEIFLKCSYPQGLKEGEDFYRKHMKFHYKKLSIIIDRILGKYQFQTILFNGFQIKLEQWPLASILANKISNIDKEAINIAGGLANDTVAKKFLLNFVDFDLAVWGEGEDALLQLKDYFLYKRTEIRNIPAILFKDGNQIISTDNRRRNYSYFTKNNYPDFSDFYSAKKEYMVSSLSILPIEASRGCHWNKCSFCYLNKGYKYRRKSPERVKEELLYMINKWKNYNFEFLDNDLIGGDYPYFDILLDKFIEIKKEHSNFQIVTAEIITKGLNEQIIKKMHRAGFVRVQIGYESTSETILSKINKKNTFASNFLFIKFGIKYDILPGQCNIIMNIPEETSLDIIDAINNLHFLRFLITPNKFQHFLIKLYINSSSRYYKYMLENKSSWLPSIYDKMIPSNFLKKEYLLDLVEFTKLGENILWHNFIALENYYLNNRFKYNFSYAPEGIIYNEYINDNPTACFLFDPDDVELEIMKYCNDQVKSLDELIPHLMTNHEVTKKHTVKCLNELKKTGLIYHNRDYSEIITIVDISSLDQQNSTMNQIKWIYH